MVSRMQCKKIVLFLCYSSFLYSYDYDLIIIGAGTAGMKAALLAHEMGKKVALIEKDKQSGNRFNHGDVPYRFLYDLVMHIDNNLVLQNNGIAKTTLEYTQLRNYISSYSNDMNRSVRHMLKYTHHIDLLYGSPTFIDDHTLLLGKQAISADKYLIATGSRSYIPPLKGLEEVAYCTQETFFSIKQLPESMLIMGGGPWSIELALVLRVLGVKVTLLVEQPFLLPTFDYELVERLTQFLLSKGIIIQCNVNPVSVCNKDGTTIVTVLNKAGETYTFDTALLCIAGSIVPNTDTLALDKAGVKTYADSDHHMIHYGNIPVAKSILVNNYMQTTVNNIYASGDVTGLQIAQRAAIYQAMIAVHNMFYKEQKAVHYSLVPRVVQLLDKQLVSVGLSEQEAIKQLKDDITIYRYEDTYTHTKDMIRTLFPDFIKCLCDSSGRIVGIHALGKNAQYIVDTVTIGDLLQQFFHNYYARRTVSFDYYDMMHDLSYKCYTDINKKKQENSQGISHFWTLFL